MMWARTAEIMLGCWLLLSPFIFRHPAGATGWWANDLLCGTIVILLSLLSFWSLPFWRAIRRAHLLNLAVALWLIGFAYFTSDYPPAPALQNHVILGLLLLMLPLVPSEADLPPEEWQEFLTRELEQNK
jgi:hypothetical protein